MFRPNMLSRGMRQTSIRTRKGASVETLKTNGKIPFSINEVSDFDGILKKYSPHFENGKLVAASENSYEEIIENLKDEKNIFLSFAHPGYFANHVENAGESLKYFTENSKGLIKSFKPRRPRQSRQKIILK